MAISKLKIVGNRITNPDPTSDGKVIAWGAVADAPSVISISVAENHEIGEDDYDGLDPTTSALVVNVTAAATVTLPEDPAEGQTITLVKSGTAGYLVTVSSGAEPFQALINGGVQGSVADHELNGGYAPLLASQFAATWQYRSGGWCAVSVPRQHAFMTAGGLRLNGYSIPCKPDADTGVGSALVIGESTVLRRLAGGNLTAGKVVEELCTFQSSDSKLKLDQVSSSAQLTGTIATGNNADLAGPADIANGEYVRIAWTVLLTIAGVDYVADYVAAYKRASGTLAVIQEHAVFSAPPNVTITAAISGANQPELNIANATGSDLTYCIHHSASRQVK